MKGDVLHDYIPDPVTLTGKVDIVDAAARARPLNRFSPSSSVNTACDAPDNVCTPTPERPNGVDDHLHVGDCLLDLFGLRDVDIYIDDARVEVEFLPEFSEFGLRARTNSKRERAALGVCRQILRN